MTAFDYSLEPNGVLTTVTGTGTPAAVTFGASYDHGSPNYSPTTQLSINDAGLYVVQLNVPWPYQVGGLRGAAIRLDGVDYVSGERDPDNVNDSQNIVALAYLIAGSVLSARIYQNSGHTLSFTGSWLRVALIHP